MMSRKGAHSQEGANYARLEMASDFAGAMDIDEPEFDADEIPIVRKKRTKKSGYYENTVEDINRVTGSQSRRDASDTAAKEKNDEGVASFTAGESEKAARLLEEAIALSPQSVAYRKTLATIYGDMGKQFEEATMYMQIGELSKSADDFEQAAELFLQLNEEESALECYRKASLSDPKNDKWHVARADLLRKRGENTEALQALRVAFDRLNAQRADNKASTIERAQNINEVDMRFYQIATQLATLLNAAGEVKASNDIWQKAYSRLILDWDEPTRVTASTTVPRPCNIASIFLPIIASYTYILLASEEWDTAIHLLDKAQLRVAVSDFPVHLTIASYVSKIRIGQFKMVKAPFRQLLTKRNVKNSKSAFFALSDALIAVGEVEEALSVLLHVQSEYDVEDTWMRLARCYELKDGSGEKALEHWRRCFEASPANPEFALGLQNACRKYHRATEGLEVADLHKQAIAALGPQSSGSPSKPSASQQNARIGAKGSVMDAPNGSALTHPELMNMADFSALDASKKASYASEEHQLELSFGHADLLWLNRRHLEHIAVLTPILQRNDILFYRSRTRHGTVSRDVAPIENANVPRKRRLHKVPVDGYSSGIAAVKITKNNNGDEAEEQVPAEVEYTLEFDEEDDEDTNRNGDASGSEFVSASGTKKRKRGRKQKTATPQEEMVEPDPLADAEHVAVAASGMWEAVVNKARLQEMRERKNLWEVVGLNTFATHLTHFCRSLLVECAHDGVVGAGGHYFWDDEQKLVHVHHKPLLLDHSAILLEAAQGADDSIGYEAAKESYQEVNMWKVVNTVYELIYRENAYWNDDVVDPRSRSELRFIVARVAYTFRAYQQAAELSRQLCFMHPENGPVWHFYFKAVNQTRDFYMSKGWTRRLVAKHPDNVYLQLLTGHLSLMSRSYQFAIGSYLEAFSRDETSPATLLSIGIAFLGRALSRTCPDRNQALIRAFTFFYKYYIQNTYGGVGSTHEAVYNLARAFHHVSLYQYAIPLYKKVLAHSISDRLYIDCTNQHLTLKREAAYNLVHIYRASGAIHLARELLADYLTF